MIESENVINIETSGGRIGMISNIISYQISESAETVYIRYLTCAIFSLDMMDKRCVVSSVDY